MAFNIAKWLALAGFVTALIVFVSGSLLWWNFAFQAVSCVPPAGTPTAPRVMHIRVETDRKGHIAERHLLGCTFYSYEAPTQAPTVYSD